jgi:hypothetical protein
MTDQSRAKTKSIAFSPEQHQEAFALWYKCGKPEYKEMLTILKEQWGQAPALPTLYVWHRQDDWDGHADALDGLSEQAGDIEIIKQRQDIIAGMADVGQKLVKMGMDYLDEKGLDNSADAIRAIGKGAELQDKLLGWAAYFAELSTATNEELEKKLKRFMGDEPIEATAIDVTTEQDDTERPE